MCDIYRENKMSKCLGLFSQGLFPGFTLEERLRKNIGYLRRVIEHVHDFFITITHPRKNRKKEPKEIFRLRRRISRFSFHPFAGQARCISYEVF